MSPPRRSASSSALFDLPKIPKGRAERAAEASIAGWRAEGHRIGPLESASLRSQAHAVDLGEAAGDSWAIANANRILLEIARALGVLAGDQTDPYDELLAGLRGDVAGAGLPHEPPA